MARTSWWAGICMVCALATAQSAPADETAAPAAAEASIAFADRNIWNWQVIDDQTVLIETVGHKWYKAKLLSRCIDLPFVERVGFVSNSGSGSFDKFSQIKVRGQTCALVSLTETPAPPKKGKKPAAAASKPGG